MTHDKWVKLSNDEKRIKVAELCGWKIEDTNGSPYSWVSPTVEYKVEFGLFLDQDADNIVPDYLNDLNAMHEAEMLIPIDSLLEWCGNLAKVCTPSIILETMGDVIERTVHTNRASAAERAEAFVLTMEPK